MAALLTNEYFWLQNYFKLRKVYQIIFLLKLKPYLDYLLKQKDHPF